jgi:hypothetical protein
MTKRVIEHEIKLQKSVIVILAVLAIGVCANAFAPAFSIKDALAAGTSISGYLTVDCLGCN